MRLLMKLIGKEVPQLADYDGTIGDLINQLRGVEAAYGEKTPLCLIANDGGVHCLIRPTEPASRPDHKTAVMCPCPVVVNKGLAFHAMQDGCPACAPHWKQYPICPVHLKKIECGHTALWCPQCRKAYDWPEELDLSMYEKGTGDE